METPTTTTAMYTDNYRDKEPKEKNCGNSDAKKEITVVMTNSTKW